MMRVLVWWRNMVRDGTRGRFSWQQDLEKAGTIRPRTEEGTAGFRGLPERVRVPVSEAAGPWEIVDAGWRFKLHTLYGQHLWALPLDGKHPHPWSRPRDFHVASQTMFNYQKRRYVFDCTHFCFSPSFWQQVFFDLARLLS